MESVASQFDLRRTPLSARLCNSLRVTSLPTPRAWNFSVLEESVFLCFQLLPRTCGWHPALRRAPRETHACCWHLEDQNPRSVHACLPAASLLHCSVRSCIRQCLPLAAAPGSQCACW